MTAIGFGARFRARRRGFDFSGGVMPAGATLTRESAGTRIDATGALVSAGTDVARFGHDPVTLALRGLMIEPAATNALVASRDLGNAAWVKALATAGTSIITETASSGVHSLSQLPAFAAGTVYCLSVVAREVAGPKRYLILFFQANAFGAALSGKFDLATGAVVFVSAGLNASVVPAAGGRWLCAISATATVTVAAGTANAMIRLSDATGASSTYTGDGTGGIDVTDCQIETGNVPTSRIVTTTAAASRAADVLTLDWRGRGVADGAAVLRYTFDDGTNQDVAATVAGGLAVAPTTLARAWLRRVEAV